MAPAIDESGYRFAWRNDERGEPEVTLSPLRYHYQHRAEIEAVVQGEARSAQQMQGSGGPSCKDRTTVTPPLTR